MANLRHHSIPPYTYSPAKTMPAGRRSKTLFIRVHGVWRRTPPSAAGCCLIGTAWLGFYEASHTDRVVFASFVPQRWWWRSRRPRRRRECGRRRRRQGGARLATIWSRWPGLILYISVPPAAGGGTRGAGRPGAGAPSSASPGKQTLRQQRRSYRASMAQ
jgi:hypothetical protein